MTDQPFLKCACQSCGGAIEFPAPGVGLSVQCPHCAQRTLLTASDLPPVEEAPPVAAVAFPSPPRPVPQPASPVPASASRKSPVLMVVLLLACGALAGGAAWYFTAGPGATRRGTSESPDNNAAGPPSNGHSPKDETSPNPPAPASAPAKSTDDLKPGPVKLEKAKSGNLMYAVGTVKNDSSHQRFGVKVEITFTDAKGNPAGRTTDYTQVIEPRQEWRFRALVLDSKAVSGQVAGIIEDK